MAQAKEQISTYPLETTAGATPDMATRMARMMALDRWWAIAFIVALWAVYAFVFFATLPYTDDGAVIAVLIGGGALVLLYNTGSIAALIKHYIEDKEYIYGLDIRHLDEMRAAKLQRRREH